MERPEDPISKKVIYRQTVGSNLARRLRIENHDARARKNLIRIGETTTGLPVWANKTVARASLKILTGLRLTPLPDTAVGVKAFCLAW